MDRRGMLVVWGRRDWLDVTEDAFEYMQLRGDGNILNPCPIETSKLLASHMLHLMSHKATNRECEFPA